jgi:hypothetical protein
MSAAHGPQSKAAVMWDGGGRMYDDISRSLASTTCVTPLQPEPGEQNASHRHTLGTTRGRPLRRTNH